jgi:hypothetical protein
MVLRAFSRKGVDGGDLDKNEGFNPTALKLDQPARGGDRGGTT